MDNEKLVSIVVPVYNVEKYLEDCIESLINQTYKNIEILLIDDGSKDKSPLICDKYKEIDNRIKVIHQENSGLSATRNVGISILKGYYVTFIDSDDYVDSNYVKTLVDNIGENDLLTTGYVRVTNDKKCKFTMIPKNTEWEKLKFCNVAGKLYKVSFLKNNKIIYEPNVKYAEDLNFYLKIYSNSNNIKLYKYSGYFYRESVGSIVVNKKYRETGDSIIYLKRLYKIIEDGKVDRFLDEQNKKMLLYYFQKTAIFYCLSKRKMISYRELCNEMNESFEYLNSEFKKKNEKISLIWQKGEKFSINLLVNTIIVSYKMKFLKILMYFLKLV